MAEVEDYLGSLDEGRASILRPYYERAHELIDGLEDGRSYGMPALKYRGKALIALQATKAGFSAYPFSGVVVSVVAGSHPELETTSGSVHFTSRHPLPLDAFDELVLARRNQIDGDSASP